LKKKLYGATRRL